MDLSRSRTLYLIVWMALMGLSLRPVERVDAVLEWVFAPCRVLGELASPLRWLSRSNVHAAESSIVERTSTERAESLALLAAEEQHATPTDPTLRAGRGFIHARIVEPGPDPEASVVVRYAPDAQVEVGMPVVCRDTFVGRVERLEPRVRGEASVALITGPTFRVGAIVEDAGADGGARLVVGGIAPYPPDDPLGLHLAAHAPSTRELSAGLVRVREDDSLDAQAYRRLADGYRLGELASYRVQAVPVLAVRAGLDYTSGLSQVVVLCPAGRVDTPSELAHGRFSDGNWLDAEFVLNGNASFWRESRKLDVGERQGVAPRAVVALGARLVGFVAHVGAFTSDVALLGDPGLTLSVLARVTDASGSVRPVTLGRMVSIGRDRGDDTLLLRWDVSVSPFGQEGETTPIEASLFTGSGEREVPPGLWIGRALLPRRRGSHVVHVSATEPVSQLCHVRVLCPPRTEVGP